VRRRSRPSAAETPRRSRVGVGHQTLAPGGVEEIDLEALERDLRSSVRGEIRFDAGTRAAYSHDSSNYRQPPLGVVIPATRDDLVAAVRVCHDHRAPVLPRGSATSLSGQTTNVAVAIDVSKSLRGIIEVDPVRRVARVEPGVIRDELANLVEREHNLTFAPDTSTHAYATFGGMIGNNSCGVHSVMAGRTADNVESLEIVTYDGLRMRVGATSEADLEEIVAGGGRRGEIYGAMRALRDRHAELIRERYPEIPRRVSGYSLDELLPEKGFNVGRALVGSEGTLATVLEATVRLVDSPPARSLLVLGYPSIFEAADHVEEILELGPTGLEGIEASLVRAMIERREITADVPKLPDGEGWLLVEFGGEERTESRERAQSCMERLQRGGGTPDARLFDHPAEERRLWEIREAGLGATAHAPMVRDAWPGWEDAAVPPPRLGDYLRRFRGLMERHGYDAVLYGHFGDGCVHCRINFDLRSDQGLRRWRRFLDEAADLVVEFGGSLSGEHGDGQQRAELLPKMYGEELVGAFREMKRIWDPDNRMNPHKVVDPYPILSNMKLGAGYDPPEPRTHFAYPDDGGSFANAAMRCVGAGNCRDPSRGTMCPSYMATLDEEHTTRGRARILYEMLEGKTITGGFRSKEVQRALDLCLSCKGCKADCPVSVDMATYKAEFLSGHYRRRLRPRQAYSMGLIMLHARVAQRVPRLANFLTHAPGLGAVAKRAGGISPDRAMPRFATQTFRAWWDERGAVNRQGTPVVLFPDTFSNFLRPEVLRAAVTVLEGAGFRILVPERTLCCGRPLYDYGMLDTAKRFWRRTLRALAPHIRQGVPVVGLEPSCVAAFRDELLNLMPRDDDARRLSLQTLTLAELLQQHAPDWDVPTLAERVIVHGHCHQEAVIGMDADQELFERLGLDFELLDSGCCGLAGSFGFERDHDEISRQIGEQRLMPAVRGAGEDTLVVADGFSCRTQIEELTGRCPWHTAEVVERAMQA
jgi:FAD/FMN-containing dehydrogenase/Fe-S oxidoreductase